MSKINRMLVNATHPNEELRFAVTQDGYLENLYIEKPGSEKKSNIYKAIITRVEASLQACFVDFGAQRHGFLPFKEIAQEYYQHAAQQGERPDLARCLKEGQEVMVQVEKEERGNKGAALTTYISLAGSYLVLMLNNPKAGGISRQIEGSERDELKAILNNLNLPGHMGTIIRTAGVGKSQAELQWDLDILLRFWTAIQEAYQERPGPFLIHQESDIVAKAIRDYLRPEIDEILIDNGEIFERAKRHIEQVRPEFLNRIKSYDESVPLFTKFQIENQIETAYESEVRLPSGGSLVIEQTEAMVTIDVNSSRDTKGGHIEDTAFNTNYEAAIEVARQLRLRDLGGLIVVDFIDMLDQGNQREIVDAFYNAIQSDKARVQFGRISKFGLLEISRQRLRPSLSESNQMVCPRCSGKGTIRSTESLAMLILRLLHEDALQKDVIGLDIQAPVSVATYLMNEKRDAFNDIEKQLNVLIRIIPNQYMETPEYKINRIFRTQGRHNSAKTLSYDLVTPPEPTAPKSNQVDEALTEEPAVQMTIPERPSELERKSTNLIQRLWKTLTTSSEPSETESVKQPSHQPSRHAHKPSHRPRQQQQRRPSSRKSRRGQDNRSSGGQYQSRKPGSSHSQKQRKSENPRKQSRQQHSSKSQDGQHESKQYNHQEKEPTNFPTVDDNYFENQQRDYFAKQPEKTNEQTKSIDIFAGNKEKPPIKQDKPKEMQAKSINIMQDIDDDHAHKSQTAFEPTKPATQESAPQGSKLEIIKENSDQDTEGSVKLKKQRSRSRQQRDKGNRNQQRRRPTKIKAVSSEEKSTVTKTKPDKDLDIFSDIDKEDNH